MRWRCGSFAPGKRPEARGHELAAREPDRSDSNARDQAKGPRRAATKAAREPDRSVVVLREDRKRSANERGRDGSGLPQTST